MGCWPSHRCRGELSKSRMGSRRKAAQGTQTLKSEKVQARRTKGTVMRDDRGSEQSHARRLSIIMEPESGHGDTQTKLSPGFLDCR